MQIPTRSIIVAGPVIIENGKVLLNKENKNGKLSPWFFPGGEVENFDLTLEDCCRREAQEELGISIRIIKPLRTLTMRRPDGSLLVMVHYLAIRSGDVVPGNNTAQWNWHDIHSLPNDCSPNVREIITDYLTETNQL